MTRGIWPIFGWLGRLNLRVEFWGVRGSIACGGPNYVRYGGNTSCVAIRRGRKAIILDAGTGLRPLGDVLMKEGVEEIHLFLSHTHFDHVCGFPFFAPAYAPHVSLTIWSGHLGAATHPSSMTAQVMAKLMEAPLFPVDPGIFRAKLAFKDFLPGAVMEPFDGLSVQTAALNHPNGATAYRIDQLGRSVVYASDHEHGEHGPFESLISFCQGADLVIYDATYTDATYAAHKGWGHSTWEQGLVLARAAQVRTLALYHHDPSHTDAVLQRIEAKAVAAGARVGVRVFAAREGQHWRP